MKNFYTIPLLFLLFVLPLVASAQWSSDPTINTPVCTATGKQVDLRMLKDGKGGAYITWKDFRNGVSDIYIQRLNAAGVPQFTPNGLPLCTDPADQSTPAIASDMKGGAIVTWSDWRSSIERDIYAQRVDSDGNIKWTLDGLVVTDKTAREHNPKIISDEAGGAIVIWEQQTSGKWDIWGQRIDSNGAIKWVSGGIAMVTGVAVMDRMNPRVEKDGKGGAIVIWQDERNGTGNFDIYAQRMDGNGNRKWGTGGIAICNSTGIQTNPKIDPDSTIGGGYIVWVDKRSGNYDIYAQRIDSSGIAKWSTNGVVVCNAGGSQSAPDIMSNDLSNGLFITWKDKRNGNYDIYAQKLNNSGTPLWAANGVVICNNAKDQLNPNIIQDNGIGAIIVWQDSSAGSNDIRAQRVSSTGTTMWAANGIAVGTATADQVQPKNVTDGNGGTIIAFEDSRSGTSDVYAHHLFANGATISSVNDVVSISNVNCYPNPFSSGLTISLRTSAVADISVTAYDVLGKQISALQPYNISYHGNTCSVHIGNQDALVPGVYFIRLSTGDQSKTVRVIKQ